MYFARPFDSEVAMTRSNVWTSFFLCILSLGLHAQDVSVSVEVDARSEFEPVGWRVVATCPANVGGVVVVGYPYLRVQVSVAGEWRDWGDLPQEDPRRGGKSRSGTREVVRPRQSVTSGNAIAWRGNLLDWRCSGFAGDYRVRAQLHREPHEPGNSVLVMLFSDWVQFAVSQAAAEGQLLREARAESTSPWKAFVALCERGVDIGRVAPETASDKYLAIEERMLTASGELRPAQELLQCSSLPRRLKAWLEISNCLDALQLAREANGQERLTQIGRAEGLCMSVGGFDGEAERDVARLISLSLAHLKGDSNNFALIRDGVRGRSSCLELIRGQRHLERWVIGSSNTPGQRGPGGPGGG